MACIEQDTGPSPAGVIFLGLLLILGVYGWHTFHDTTRRNAVHLEKAMGVNKFITLHGKDSGNPIHITASHVDTIYVDADGATHVVTDSMDAVVLETPEEVMWMIETPEEIAQKVLLKIDASKGAAK